MMYLSWTIPPTLSQTEADISVSTILEASSFGLSLSYDSLSQFIDFISASLPELEGGWLEKSVSAAEQQKAPLHHVFSLSGVATEVNHG